MSEDNPDCFREFIKSRGFSIVHLKPYSGNSGDGLIVKGCTEMLHQLGVEITANPSKAEMILWPGGNVSMWQELLDEMQNCWRRWPDKPFVIAPATFQGTDKNWRGVIETSPANIVGLFARDPLSYRNLNALNIPQSPHIGLANDPAFYLKESQWLRDWGSAGSEEYALLSFRRDHEMLSCDRGQVISNSLISRISRRVKKEVKIFRQNDGTASRQDPRRVVAHQIVGVDKMIIDKDASMLSFDFFVETVNRASEIHTDRLHCMILGALLGKKVYGYKTAFGKLEDIFEYSIKGWSSVEFPTY